MRCKHAPANSRNRSTARYAAGGGGGGFGGLGAAASVALADPSHTPWAPSDTAHDLHCSRPAPGLKNCLVTARLMLCFEALWWVVESVPMSETGTDAPESVAKF